jgi:hypothetical protein
VTQQSRNLGLDFSDSGVRSSRRWATSPALAETERLLAEMLTQTA